MYALFMMCNNSNHWLDQTPFDEWCKSLIKIDIVLLFKPPCHYLLALCLWGMSHDLILTCPWACPFFIVTMECNPRHVPYIWGLEVHAGTPRWNYDKGVNTSSLVNKVNLHQSNHKLVSISCNHMVLNLNHKQVKFIWFTLPKRFKTFWNFNSQNDP
jgi:hypothetical protein